MATPAEKAVIPIRDPRTGKDRLIRDLRSYQSGELVFAVIGYAGSGTTFVAQKLCNHLQTAFGLQAHVIKARDGIESFAAATHRTSPSATNPLVRVSEYQSLGDAMRKESEEYSAVAAYMIRSIREIRGKGSEKRCAFLLDSLKHPAEVELLRHVYSDGFCLIGVGCRPDIREKRLQVKFRLDKVTPELEDLITRDAEDSAHDYGQQVNKTFHLADYFVDNTPNLEDEMNFCLPDTLRELTDILLAGYIHRPKNDEKGMYHAHAASMRSSCLSRQVGAAILDQGGALLAVGTNEVPKFGGGTYDEHSEVDDRCFADRKKCSNTEQQNRILEHVFEGLSDKSLLMPGTTYEQIVEGLKHTRIKSLIEFSRSVHAEMDALLSLVRSGTKLPQGSTLYSTTYPCHNCARHIVAAGVGRVVYLEPYAKSMAIDLHGDSIADNKSDKDSTNRVRFVPYQGVSPRLFRSVYLKTGELKDKKTGKMLSEDEIADSAKQRASIWSKTYVEFEKDVVDFISQRVEARGVEHGD